MNLWLTQHLATAFPTARFIGIQRNPYAVVASMLAHRGVRRWCEDGHWERTPRPNRFLGVDAENEEWYRELSITERCAQRWLVHARELERVGRAHPDQMLTLQYEEMLAETGIHLTMLQNFLGVSACFDPPPSRTESADKWKASLSDSQLEQIAALTGIEPPA